MRVRFPPPAYKLRVYQEILAECQAKGEAKGKAEATRRLALNLLRMGMNLEQISEATELSLEQVQALQNEIPQDNSN